MIVREAEGRIVYFLQRLYPRRGLYIRDGSDEVLGLARFIVFRASPETLPILNQLASFTLSVAHGTASIP